MSRKRSLTAAAALVGGLALSLPALAGMQVAGDDDQNLKVGLLFQAHGHLSEDAPAGGWGTDLYVRRLRLMVYGQLSPKINFFVETDNPSYGLDGNLTGNTFIQDAYVEYVISDAFQLDLGFLLIPFVHHSTQGAISLLGLNYHPLVKHPSGSNRVWREPGLMARGILSDGLFEYRLAISDGVRGNATPLAVDADGDGTAESTISADARNAKDLPRVSARVSLSLFDSETGPGVGGMFYDGLYIKKTDAGTVSTKKVLAIGAAFSMQPGHNIAYGAPAPPTAEDPTPLLPMDSEGAYMGIAADVFWDIPLNADKTRSLNGQVNWVMYDFGDRTDANTWYDYTGSGSYSGMGIMAEAGVRFDAIQPVVAFDWYDSTKAATDETGDYLGINGGVNWWIHGHSASLKLVGGAASVSGGDMIPSVTIQSQLLI